MTVTIDRAAQLLGRSRRTVYNRINHGSLRTVRVGISRRITIESLARQPEFMSRKPFLDQVLTRTLIPHPKRGG